MKPKELIKLLEEEGFVFARQSGSHLIYKKHNSKIIVVPYHNRDIPIGTLNGILKDSGIKK
ncbi:MAG: type II toxin-antitoxin system HicA family toxin [Candidatus Kapabacteria bacterium]|nr:type II toxin-antitoxin system HicA family toxin [Candidatus Kapabacteria bacterium]